MKKTSVAFAALLLLGACSSGTDDPTSATEGDVGARIVTFQFEPDPLEIEVGTSVTWTNTDNIDHTVTSGVQREQGVPGVSEDEAAQPDGEFRGELPEKDATFSFTFESAGEFTYFCEIHAGMTGTVIVK